MGNELELDAISVNTNNKLNNMSNTFDSGEVNIEEGSKKNFQYVGYGIQELKINGMEIKIASTGSKQVILSVEGRPVVEDNWVGVDGAKGPVGKIKTIYMKPEFEGEFTKLMAKIATSMDVRDKLDAIKGTKTLEDYLTKSLAVLKGKWANFVVSTEQYIGQDGKTKNSLRFSKFDFVEKVGAKPSKLKFDKANVYHFKPAVVPDNIGTEQSGTFVKQDGNDLPF